jgi:hypothetical protein
LFTFSTSKDESIGIVSSEMFLSPSNNHGS